LKRQTAGKKSGWILQNGLGLLTDLIDKACHTTWDTLHIHLMLTLRYFNYMYEVWLNIHVLSRGFLLERSSGAEFPKGFLSLVKFTNAKDLRLKRTAKILQL
jgi:hypothetical protein